MKFKQAATKVAQFLKKNIYYVLIIVCIGAIATMVYITVRNNKIDDTTPIDVVEPVDPVDPIDPIDPIDPVVIVFSSPVENSTVGKGYSNAVLVWSETLNQFQTHEGIDFLAEEGTAVKAVYGGTVESVTFDKLNGNTVIINHGDGLKSVYGSLGSTSVSEGSTVTTGTVIGTVSTTMMSESADGSHLHFEVIEDNLRIDPMVYLVATGK